MTEYHCVDSCNKCSGVNDVTLVDSIEYGRLCEATTKCTVCGHNDYWAYGFFESGADMVSNCEKYSFKSEYNGATMTNKTIHLIIFTLLLLLLLAPIAMACEKSTEFGCSPLIDCYPCDGGWCYYKDKK